MGSFAEYLVLSEFAMDWDAGLTSTFLYKDLEDVLHLCVWDFNRAFDNYREPLPIDQLTAAQNGWFIRMMEDPAFVDCLVRTYERLRSTTLSDAHLAETVDKLLDALGPAAERNFARWGYTFQQYMLHNVDNTARNPADHAQVVQQLEDTMARRLAYLDQTIPTLTQTTAQ